MTAKEIDELLAELYDRISQAWEVLPAYSRTADCLADAQKSIEIAMAFHKQESVLPNEIEKPKEDDDLLTGKCPFCEGGVTSEDNYCSRCGHKIVWR